MPLALLGRPGYQRPSRSGLPSPSQGHAHDGNGEIGPLLLDHQNCRPLRLNSRITSRIRSTRIGESPIDGSSSTIRRGFAIRALSIERICCWRPIELRRVFSALHRASETSHRREQCAIQATGQATRSAGPQSGDRRLAGFHPTVCATSFAPCTPRYALLHRGVRPHLGGRAFDEGAAIAGTWMRLETFMTSRMSCSTTERLTEINSF
jgi:hypothetical protein